jgi:diacylglycerol kinase family enzyme
MEEACELPDGGAASGRGRPLPVVVNARAGLGMKVEVEAFTHALDAAGIAFDLRSVQPQHLDDEVRRLAASDADVVGVCGGDGTLHSAAQHLSGARAALAPIPAGTLNHFSRWLGIATPEEAVEAIAAGRTRTVPLGVLDDFVFLNTAVVGAYADAVRRRNRLRRWLTKWPAAVVGIAATVIRMRAITLEMVSDGRVLVRRTPLVWVGLGRGSFPHPHEAPVQGDPPLLEVVVLRTPRRRDLLALLARLPLRMLRRQPPAGDPALEILRVRRMLVRGDRSVGVTMDGEIFRLRPPLFLAAQEDALRVVVPDDGTRREGR